ncbi:MAG: methylmalonyl-CoA decarboxylase [Actinobacteria bacterium]|nr:methylmalonyl-CoA decarboxylase [Actinomycetota bacterium]
MNLITVRHVGDDDDPASVVEVTMTNGARRNAMGAPMLAALTNALVTAEEAGCRALVFRAEPGVSTWSAGYDIAELPVDGSDPLTWTNPLEGFLHAVRQSPFPVIAAVEGGVWGGACEFVFTCDLIVAVRTASFAITPARLGVPYNTAGVAHLLSALPLNIAKELFFTADPISAEAAASYGVVSRLVADTDEMTTTATELGRRIASLAPLAIRAIKGEMTALTDARSLTSDDFERLTSLRRDAWTSQDYQEGIRAFSERRKPRFEGR